METDLNIYGLSKLKRSEYDLLDMIDYGSFGDIYKVNCKTDNKTYAMKEIRFRGNFRDDPYIISEIYCLTHLKHKNIIKMHDILIDKGQINIIMEYAENENLERHLELHRDMEFHKKYKIYFQILQGVKYCHSMDIAHRDLTPVNVLLTNDMVVKIADFGLAVKSFTEKGDPLMCSDYLGHSSYLPPEVLTQMPFLPKPADVWSIGIMLLFLLFRTVPYTGLESDILEEQLRHSWREFVRRKSKDSIKSEIIDFVSGALALEVNKRSNICDLIRGWDTIGQETFYEKTSADV